MQSRIYYGEYSLSYWIEMMMKGKIVLPEYQRYFVWKEEHVRNLIASMREGLFVPPVSIGKCQVKDKDENLIIDGQQRLTSILLAYFDVFPDANEMKKKLPAGASENDDEQEDGEDDNIEIIEWRFDDLLQGDARSLDKVQRKINEGGFRKLNLQFDPDPAKNDDAREEFFKNTFLGFSYLVPQADSAHQIYYYSSVFRNINEQGIRLEKTESRKALYFLDDQLSDYFCSSLEQDVMVDYLAKHGHIDYVRYLAFGSQFKKAGNANRLAQGFKSKMEKYYERFIFAVVNEGKPGGESIAEFEKHSVVYSAEDYHVRSQRLCQTYKDLELPRSFNSIINADVYLMGIVYLVMFEGKELDVARRDALKAELESKAESFKGVPSHKKSPATLTYLRTRMRESVEIYKKYLIAHGA